MQSPLKLALATLLAVAAPGRPCLADSLLAMSGPLAFRPTPAALDTGPFGSFDVRGAVSALAFLQDNPSRGDSDTALDLDNAQLFVQSSGGSLQLFAAIGAYALPSLGTPYVSATRLASETYGYVPEAFAKFSFSDTVSIQAGKLPSLIGDEAVFTIENINLERGLLWNQTPSISRGVQLNYTSGAVALSLSWNDGFYANRFNWISGAASYTLGSMGTVALLGGANLGHTAYADFATPLAQNNSAILDIAYTLALDDWTLNPYLQLSEIPRNGAAGVSGSGHSVGIAMLVIRKLNDNWSIGARGEDLSAGGDENLLYGPRSSAWSFTLTPTYQKGVLFARAEASYVGLSRAQPGAGLGRAGESNSQARLMLETGLLF
ncbi:MAG TPA: outer membrane beta-barrel protein [Rhizomicrobium sp.]|nr:outer membrane beta-barrel protein [Rhizomicrobium sp.]